MFVTVVADCENCGPDIDARIGDCDSCYEQYLEEGGDPGDYDGSFGCDHLSCTICGEGL